MEPIEIVTIIGLALVLTLIAIRLIVKKKKGCVCLGCPYAGSCSKKKTGTEKTNEGKSN